jgi:hypothetical protein
MKLTKSQLKEIIREELQKEDFGMAAKQMQPFSSPEAKKIMDSSLRDYVKDLRKLQGRVVKDWMSKAKSKQMDFYDIVRGLQTGDASRAYPYETKFLFSVLTKDKIIDRFRKYFGGKKSMNNRLSKRDY